MSTDAELGVRTVAHETQLRRTAVAKLVLDSLQMAVATGVGPLGDDEGIVDLCNADLDLVPLTLDVVTGRFMVVECVVNASAAPYPARAAFFDGLVAALYYAHDDLVGGVEDVLDSSWLVYDLDRVRRVVDIDANLAQAL